MRFREHLNFSGLRTGLPYHRLLDWLPRPCLNAPRSGPERSDFVPWHRADDFGAAARTVSYRGSCRPAQQGEPTPANDPVRVKTPKRRPRRGIVFFQCPGFRAGFFVDEHGIATWML